MTGRTFDLAETDRLLTTTRAVRKRLDLSRPVEPEIILECLKIAVQAPSGGNGQRWRWMVVRDAAHKAVIADEYRRAYEAYTAPRRAQLGAEDRAAQRVLESSDFLADHLAEVPVLVIPCTLDELAPGASGRDMAGVYGGIIPAVWSFQLALRSRGLGSAYTTLHLESERVVGELLGIPPTVMQVALLPVAYFVGDDFRPAVRRPVESLTYWDAWKQTDPERSPEAR